MTAQKKVKVFRTTLKHGNTYTAGPYHFSLGRPVDIPERDAAIAEHLRKHPSFTVMETYVAIGAPVDAEPVIEQEVLVQEETPDVDSDVETETETEEAAGETAKAHQEITTAPKASAPKRLPTRK